MTTQASTSPATTRSDTNPWRRAAASYTSWSRRNRAGSVVVSAPAAVIALALFAVTFQPQLLVVALVAAAVAVAAAVWPIWSLGVTGLVVVVCVASGSSSSELAEMFAVLGSIALVVSWCAGAAAGLLGRVGHLVLRALSNA